MTRNLAWWENPSTARDEELWAGRIGDLVAKLEAVAERARMEAASASRDGRLDLLDAVIAHGRAELLRLSEDGAGMAAGEAPQPSDAT